MTVILLTKKKGEKAIRTEYDNCDELTAWNKGSLMKFDDKSIFVIIFGKGGEVDKKITKSIKEMEENEK